MNVQTGEIRNFSEDQWTKVLETEPALAERLKDWVPVDESQMTLKQKADMQVSKHDSVSELGKLFTGNRAERRRQVKKSLRLLK